MTPAAPLPRILMLIVLTVAALGLSGVGAELVEAIPLPAGDVCQDDCADGDAPGCDGICLCACCPPPAVAPTSGASPGASRAVNLDPAPVLRHAAPAVSAPYHPPR